MNLNGKRVVITGASSGIGLELVKLLAARGCIITAAARRIEQAGISGPGVFLKKCDVSVKEDVDSLFSFALDKMGGIDLFIANAGFAYYEKIAAPDWGHIRTIYDTNVISLVYCAEKMKELHGSRPYHFLATASGMSLVSLPGYALYGSTKAAVHSFAEAYRYELEKGQIFQLVYPVATRTNFFKNAGDGPLPFPVQSVGTVVRSIVKGIEKDRKRIFPSGVFVATYTANRVFPFILKLYAGSKNKKFLNWLKSKG